MYSEKSKKAVCLDSFPKQIYNILVIFRLISVFETIALLNLPIYSIFLGLPLPGVSMASFVRSNKVTDEAFYS